MTIFRILMAAFEKVAAIKINVYRPSNDDLGSAISPLCYIKKNGNETVPKMR